MEGKELINGQLDLLVKMAEHCTNKNKPRGKIKCNNCALNWNFSLSDNGCFLVEMVDRNDKFIDDLISCCVANNIEYKDKLKKIADIFVTEYE